jgi:probable RNA-binding protein EIF1AD
MARPKRNVLATIDSTITPPDALSPNHVIARITRAEGKNIYAAELPGGKSVLAELEPRFRSTVWIKRGSYVVVDTSALADRENKLDGEIVNVVRDEKAWRKMSYWCVLSGYHATKVQSANSCLQA